jgi:NAD-dependent deacetylase
MTSVDIPDSLIEAVRTSSRIVALTGSGISAESGVPTFRDAQTGLWSRFNPEELATPEAYARNPRLVWEWYAHRRELVRRAVPNAGHHALVEMERRVPDWILVTQNVDGLHQRAGSGRVLELHGNIHRTQCFENNHPVDQWPETDEVPPRCPLCGGRLRPAVVWFNENLPERILDQAFAAADRSEVFLSVGTSSLVYPAAQLPHQAADHGALLVEINPEPTPLSPRVDFSLRGPAGRLLPALVRAAWPGE